MSKKQDNYQIQMAQAKRLFLTYDQQELIRRCALKYDEEYFYISFLSSPYRICRKTGDMERFFLGAWVDGNGYGEVMTILDWLCDSRPDRYISGRWSNIINQGHYFHRQLQEDGEDPEASLFDKRPQAFCAACEALEGEKMPGADIAYAIPLVDGLRVLVQLWHSDEEFPARVRFLWDENVLRYIRYETTWFALGILLKRILENIPMETDRLFLRPWREQDAKYLYEYARDPDVGPAAGWPVHTSVENSRDIIRNVLAVPYTYAVCLKENDRPIGSIGLKMGDATDLTDREDECELGYWVGKPYWGQGIIPEAARELLQYAFTKLSMKKVWCGYYDGNEKSHRVQEKLGFVYHHTSCDVEVPLLGENRTGHVSVMTYDRWRQIIG